MLVSVSKALGPNVCLSRMFVPFLPIPVNFITSIGAMYFLCAPKLPMGTDTKSKNERK